MVATATPRECACASPPETKLSTSWAAHKHDWVIDLVTNRVRRGDCPACAPPSGLAAPVPRGAGVRAPMGQ